MFTKTYTIDDRTITVERTIRWKIKLPLSPTSWVEESGDNLEDALWRAMGSLCKLKQPDHIKTLLTFLRDHHNDAVNSYKYWKDYPKTPMIDLLKSKETEHDLLTQFMKWLNDNNQPVYQNAFRVDNQKTIRRFLGIDSLQLWQEEQAVEAYKIGAGNAG